MTPAAQDDWLADTVTIRESRIALQQHGRGCLSFSRFAGSTDTVAKFDWGPKMPFDQFDVRSIDNACRKPCYRLALWLGSLGDEHCNHGNEHRDSIETVFCAETHKT